MEWYRQLLRTDSDVYIEACENYVKQTTRNRCEIATANGKQILTVPVTIPKHVSPLGGNAKGASSKDVLVSDHGNWRHQHWEALQSAYGMSPFFEYYQDDIRPFFDKAAFCENHWEHLFDYNLAITQKILGLIGVDKEIKLTDTYQGATPIDSPTPPYYQTFQKRHGFIPDLSILDLLFNEGPSAILHLRQAKSV